MENQYKKPLDQIIMEQRRAKEWNNEKEKRLEEMKKADLDIASGSALVNDVEVNFNRMNMVEDNLSMIVPKGFREIPEELIKEAYGEDYRPQYDYSTQDASIEITYDVLFSETDEESFEIIRKEMQMQFRKEYEDYALHFVTIENAQGIDLYYFTQKQKTETGMIYSITYQLLVKEYLVMGRISCTGYRLKDWKEILFQMMCSVQIENKD